MAGVRREAVSGLWASGATFALGFGVAVVAGESAVARGEARTTVAYLALWGLFGLPISLGVGGVVMAGLAIARDRAQDREVWKLVGLFLLPLGLVFVLLLGQVLTRYSTTAPG